MASHSHPCQGFTKAGQPCANMISAASQRYCGKCGGAQRTAVLAETAVTTRAALVGLRNQQVADDAFTVAGTTAEDLAESPTASLVPNLHSRTREALTAQAAVFGLQGRDGDVPTAAMTAAKDQAAAARHAASRYEDAVLHRHPDPYGKALVTGAWEAAAPPQRPTESTQIRSWLAANPGAPPDHIHLALNTLARNELGEERLAEIPYVDALNRMAAVRAGFLHDPRSVTSEELEAAERGWRAVMPAEAR